MILNPIQKNIADMAVADEMIRTARFAQAWDAYYGRFPNALTVKKGQPDDNVKPNFCRPIVDASVSFLFGREVHFSIPEGEETNNYTDAENWLQEVWRRNRKMSLLLKLALNGAVCGHAFLKILDEKPWPRLIVIDPAYMTPVHDPDDIDQVVRYKIHFPALDPRTAKPIVKQQRIERNENGKSWQIVDEISRAPDHLGWDKVQEVTWPRDWPPVIDCQNLPAPNEYWGVSDLESDVIELNKELNFLLSNGNRIIRFHAHPKTWGRGFSADQLKIAVDDTVVLPNDRAELKNLEMQSDLGSTLDFYRELRQALHEISRSPEVASGKVENIGQLSGLAIQILYGPLVAKTETKRVLYGEMLAELNRRLSELGGFGNDVITTITWPEVLPSDAKTQREIALIDQQLGASSDTLLRKLGYDPDNESAQKAAETESLGDQLLSSFEQGL